MKRVLSGFALLIASLIAVVASPLVAVAETNSGLSKTELKTLLKTAKTPAEHREVAAYYRQQSATLRARSKEHLASAERRAKNPTFAALEVKQGFAFGLGASHCRYWANSDAAAASHADVLASLHEEMATKTELNK